MQQPAEHFCEPVPPRDGLVQLRRRIWHNVYLEIDETSQRSPGATTTLVLDTTAQVTAMIHSKLNTTVDWQNLAIGLPVTITRCMPQP